MHFYSQKNETLHALDESDTSQNYIEPLIKTVTK